MHSSARVKPYSERVQITSKRPEPTESEKYFEGSSFWPVFRRPSRTINANSFAFAAAAIECVAIANTAFVQFDFPSIGLPSIRYAAEPCINILIVWLKPVTERSAQHRPGRARRSSFEHVVFSVEKICRISRIKRKRLEVRKRLKQTGRPFPAISELPCNPI